MDTLEGTKPLQKLLNDTIGLESSMMSRSFVLNVTSAKELIGKYIGL